MGAHVDRPIGGLSSAEAAAIFGVTALHVNTLVGRGELRRAVKHQRRGLDRADVEQLALQRYRPRHPYWANTTEAADLLGITRARVLQLIWADRLPGVRHDGRWYLRRHQVQVIANARHAGRLRCRDSRP